MEGWAILFLCIVGSVHIQGQKKLDVEEPMFIQAVLDGYDSNKSHAENFYLLLGYICPRSVYCEANDTYGHVFVNNMENDTQSVLQLTRNNTQDRISEARKILQENSHKLRGCCVQCSCDKHCVERGNCCPAIGKEVQVSVQTCALLN